jgi:hypothetical protein
MTPRAHKQNAMTKRLRVEDQLAPLDDLDADEPALVQPAKRSTTAAAAVANADALLSSSHKRLRIEDQLPPLDDDDEPALVQPTKRSASVTTVAQMEANADALPSTPGWVANALDDETLRRHFAELENQGYTVIENIVDPAVCADVERRLVAFLRAAGVPFEGDKIRMDGYNPHGIQQHLEAGQCDGAWIIRLQALVQKVFARMWGDNDLLASTDAFCYQPAAYRYKGKGWLHVDQSHGKPGLRCIQGYVNVTTSHDANSGSLEVIPGSNRHHTRFGQADADARANKKDWYKYSDDNLNAMGLSHTPPRRALGGIGSLVLWDSRTAHHARAPDPSVVDGRVRAVVYTCFQPRVLCSEANLRKKAKIFNEYRMTTHWPASKVEMFSKTWQTYGKPVTVRTPPRTRDAVQTQRMLEIAGVSPMTSQPRVRTPPMLSFVSE